jgi:uncharacterized protein (DUF697 family)
MATQSRKTIATNPLDEISDINKPVVKTARARKSMKTSDTAVPVTAAKATPKTKRVIQPKTAAKTLVAGQPEKLEKAQPRATDSPEDVNLAQPNSTETRNVALAKEKTKPFAGVPDPESSPPQTAEQLMAEELVQDATQNLNRQEEIVVHPSTPFRVLAQPCTPQPKMSAGLGSVDTQVLTAEDVFQTELSRAHANIKQEESRSKRAALKIVTRWARWSVAASVIPAPLIDIAAISGVQVKMIYALCKHYEVDFEHKAAVAIASGVTGGAAVQTIAGVLAKQMVRSMPGIGTFFMFAIEPVISYATTYALGLAFISHFETEGRLHNFDPATINKYLAAQINKGKSVFDSKTRPGLV